MAAHLGVIYGEKGTFHQDGRSHKFIPILKIDSDGVIIPITSQDHSKDIKGNNKVNIAKCNVLEESIFACAEGRPRDEHSQYMDKVYTSEIIELQEPVSSSCHLYQSVGHCLAITENRKISLPINYHIVITYGRYKFDKFIHLPRPIWCC